ncbi:MAG: 5'-3' exonuclease H3TH domain-containing protein, partial [Oscillospiraceae bacterium]
MVDLKALMGDASDNIPGVPGIGEKTALDLVRRYGTVAEIYENLDSLEIKPGALKKLQEGREMAQMSFDLATICCDAPMDFRTEDALRRPYNEPALYEELTKLELMRLIDRLGLHGAQGVPEAEEQTFTAECTSEMVTDSARIATLLSEWEKADYVTVLT